jgi:hypothetical protein
MFGSDGNIRGIIPRSVEYLFQTLSRKTTSTEVAMVCSFLEIYNDQIRDLGKAYLVAMGVESSSSMALYEKTSDIFENLAGKRGNPYFAPAFHRPGSAVASNAEGRPGLKEVQDEYNTMNYEIREDNEGNVFVKDLSLVPVTTMEEVMSLISMGLRVRATHETKMNAVSSRSHTVFTITVLQRDKVTGEAITGMLNLVDLAGSERLKKSESQGIRLKEALHINTSLTALGKVIMALDPSSETTHVPYRDSKLTRVLQNSLGGNSYTSVIAAIHPSPKYYEECLSTLQFANRCRNVRNNPKVNYVDDGEDKDRKIRKLTDEVNLLRNKLSQAGQGGGGAGAKQNGDSMVSPAKLVTILKSLGINATLSPDNAILVNGKKFTLDDLGLNEGSGNVGMEGSVSGDGNRKDGSSQGNSEKLQKMIKDLKESNETYSMRAKERKLQLEEQTRELQKLSAELVKCRTVIKHKEFEYTNLMEEKERALQDLKESLDAKYKDEMMNLIKSNEELLKIQQVEKDKIPSQLKQYTQLLQKYEKQVSAIEKPLKAEFTSHLNHLESNRLTEIQNLKSQYEYWLNEKDKALSGFVESFNSYRNKKSEQLRMAEKEIVKLYEYTEQIEQILDNVEKGVYQVKQKQGTKGGKSTTGIMASMNGNMGDDGIGAIVLPKGIRPLNPLKIPNLGGDSLDLTKKIVEKHKERVARLDKMKEEAFQKSLHLAAQTGATATGQIDDILKQQVRDLLVAKSPKPVVKPSSPTRKSTSSKPPSPGTLSDQLGDLNGENKGRARPMTIHGDFVKSSDNELSKFANATAPGGLEVRSINDPWEVNNKPSTAGTAAASRPMTTDPLIPADILMELEQYRRKAKQDQVSIIRARYFSLLLIPTLISLYLTQLTTQKVLEDLASNETLAYIQRLESETDKLRRQLRDVTAQLQSAKVIIIHVSSIRCD